MTKLARVLGAVVTASAATLALTGGIAQAAPNTVHLYTGTEALCQKIGDGGVANDVFDSYECKSGFGGYSTLVDPSPDLLAGVPVFTDAEAVCETVGTNGVTNGAWSAYYCQFGIVGWTLLVDRW
ncbi:hypothetical protein ABZ816_25600 [Actinosynnema sp. NPDC047251]|uniref:Secreted protein n=1 Tax=Saccharothrix espanaensis (strain ATCC 51144 / DSM 44229 / JCM 9112 / NBRC 15066 / NRRL 15764) TaxID=1179773 RepID=K0K0C2_SACES|nr:hypothetical protein [Saccharothrix espanaensis]CCH31781.1 hypothetical protein BN6_45010 [Saccharothrix espanaensis DSM 44229]